MFVLCVYHFWVSFKQILDNRIFWTVLEPFSQQHGQKTKSPVLEIKMRSNKKSEENKSALELNFTLKYKWAGHNFEFGGLKVNITEP